jgi:hypothetical protein
MEWSWLLALLGVMVAIPSGVLAVLQILDWRRKRQARKPKVCVGEQCESILPIKKPCSAVAPADQALALIIKQAEMAAEGERLMLQELRHMEAEQQNR